MIFSYQPLPAEDLERKREPKRESTDSDRQRTFEKRPENHIVVPDELIDPHPLVARSETSIRSASPMTRASPARRHASAWTWQRPPPRSIVPYASLIRSLRPFRRGPDRVGDRWRPPANAGPCAGRKHRVSTLRGDNPAGALPTPKEIEWELRWSPERKFYATVPSGKLVLRLTDGSGLQRCWTDRSDRRVEQFLNSFVIGVYRAAESLKQERIDAERRRQEQQEQDLRRQEEERRQQAERQEEEGRRQEAERVRREEEHASRSWMRRLPPG